MISTIRRSLVPNRGPRCGPRWRAAPDPGLLPGRARGLQQSWLVGGASEAASCPPLRQADSVPTACVALVGRTEGDRLKLGDEGSATFSETPSFAGVIRKARGAASPTRRAANSQGLSVIQAPKPSGWLECHAHADETMSSKPWCGSQPSSLRA
jgi:hypothetical protein